MGILKVLHRAVVCFVHVVELWRAVAARSASLLVHWDLETLQYAIIDPTEAIFLSV